LPELDIVDKIKENIVNIHEEKEERLEDNKIKLRNRQKDKEELNE